MHITSRGQITIPMDLRKKYHISPDVELEISDKDGDIVIQKSKIQTKNNKFEKFKGIATVKMTTDEIMALTRG